MDGIISSYKIGYPKINFLSTIDTPKKTNVARPDTLDSFARIIYAGKDIKREN
ncbi:MAG: hypothetical protein AB8U25_07600 [Rickettsiales endosymbiont of Dermacentor nuttalli]